ncbi:MAG TPA: hypothetical protein VGR60_06710 [Gemmatimonadales bacterium]|nr:hypothetical protein [Gemmatimonadales bacterium]
MNRYAALLLAATFVARSVSAQVGHAPDSSPYRDITHPNGLLFTYGHIGGDGGSLGVGPHSGDSWGLRYDVKLSGLLGAHLGFSHFTGVRDGYYPNDSVSKRRTGPYSQSVTFIGVGMQANLTGPKTWHRLAPFVDAELGAAVGSQVAADTASLYDFGTKLYLDPGVGVQWFVTSRLRIRFDARRVYWKLKYPVSFFAAPTAQPTANPIIPAGGSTTEWSGNGWLSLGIHYSL